MTARKKTAMWLIGSSDPWVALAGLFLVVLLESTLLTKTTYGLWRLLEGRGGRGQR
ncbi:hypothetical protein BVRB_5g119810 [Beta vulgaris subsp. vulgaris]|nr:hypothetical protein BVRB_5g119810 [Beta vulgaris subsp. vulgaris]